MVKQIVAALKKWERRGWGERGEAIGFSKLYFLEFHAPLCPYDRKPWSIFMLALLILITTLWNISFCKNLDKIFWETRKVFEV